MVYALGHEACMVYANEGGVHGYDVLGKGSLTSTL